MRLWPRPKTAPNTKPRSSPATRAGAPGPRRCRRPSRPETADEGLRGDRGRVEEERAEPPELHADLLGGELAIPIRAATPVAIVNAAKNASVRTLRSRAAPSCSRHTGPARRSGAPLRRRSSRKTRPDAVWASTLAIADPSMPIPRPMMRSAETPIESTLADADHDERRDGVLERAHPALPGGDDQHHRRAERGDADPLESLAGSGGVASAEQADCRAGEELDHGDQGDAEADRKPRGLHADVDGLVAAVGAVAGGRPARSCRTRGTCRSRRSRRAGGRRARGPRAAACRDGRRWRCRRARRAARR